MLPLLIFFGSRQMPKLPFYQQVNSFLAAGASVWPRRMETRSFATSWQKCQWSDPLSVLIGIWSVRNSNGGRWRTAGWVVVEELLLFHSQNFILALPVKYQADKLLFQIKCIAFLNRVYCLLQLQSCLLPRVVQLVRNSLSHWSPAGLWVQARLRERWKPPYAVSAASFAPRCWSIWMWVAKWSEGWTGSGKTRMEVPPARAWLQGSCRTVTVITDFFAFLGKGGWRSVGKGREGGDYE